MPLVGRDWTQSGVTRLFSAIKVPSSRLILVLVVSLSRKSRLSFRCLQFWGESFFFLRLLHFIRFIKLLGNCVLLSDIFASDDIATTVADLVGALQENGYEVMFLSARAISQAYLTRQFLLNLKQVSKCSYLII